MLSRKLNLLYKRSLCKYLSTLPLKEKKEIENDVSVDLSSEIQQHDKTSVLKHPDYFQVHNLFTVKDLFDAKVHYGHKETALNDKMKPFVFGSRLGHIIFDLDKTALHLRLALNIAAHIAYLDGVILFISRNPQFTVLVEKTALECKEFAVCRYWKLGLFTDSEKVFKCITRLPDLCIFLNTLEENGAQHKAVVDSAKMCIPSIAIVDSNCDPNLITYPVPGNDDSLASAKLYCNLFKEAILRGKNKRNELKDLQPDTITEDKPQKN